MINVIIWYRKLKHNKRHVWIIYIFLKLRFWSPEGVWWHFGISLIWNIWNIWNIFYNNNFCTSFFLLFLPSSSMTATIATAASFPSLPPFSFFFSFLFLSFASYSLSPSSLFPYVYRCWSLGLFVIMTLILFFWIGVLFSG